MKNISHALTALQNCKFDKEMGTGIFGIFAQRLQLIRFSFMKCSETESWFVTGKPLSKIGLAVGVKVFFSHLPLSYCCRVSFIGSYTASRVVMTPSYILSDL